MIKVLFICHGNICRSPMAEAVLTNMVKEQGLEHQFQIASAATSTEEIGNGIHHGTREKLKEKQIPIVPHHAVQMTRRDYTKYDYIIGMDSWNRRNMLRIAGDDSEGKIHLLLDFTEHPRDVADPWYTGDFEQTYEDVVNGCEGFLQYLKMEGTL
ncbi:MAG: low molecular weight phosphotyrosine protein phosphatase [Lachnospiraceae bacterium]|jgi:protein-tyrosine phosphatase|nr:low molecular weight phosphotyrosine protein phosphatase [Lachnospiraceae bacterium]MDD3616992.1 low molecular weight phosphotyrosine protein phosphatase [Lachnospiraceae bacterium]